MDAKWLLRFSCLIQVAALGVLWVFEAVLMKDRGLGESAIGLILAIGSGVHIAAALFWGRLADRRVWHKRIVLWGTIGSSLSLLLFSFCSGFWQFLLYSVFRAIAIPMVIGIMPAVAIKVIGETGQGRSFGLYRAFGSMGFIIGTMAMPWIFNDIVIVARIQAFFLLTSILLVWRLPDPNTSGASKFDLKAGGLNRPITLFLISYFFIAFTDPATFSFFHAYARSLGGSTRLLGGLSGMMGAIALVSLPIMGSLIDRVKGEWVLSAAFFAHVCRLLLNSMISDPNYLWVPILLHGISWGGVEVSAVVYLAKLGGEGSKATLLSYYMAVRTLGAALGSGAIGYLAENAGYVTMFRTMALVAFAGLSIYLLGQLRSSKRREPS